MESLRARSIPASGRHETEPSGSSRASVDMLFQRMSFIRSPASRCFFFALYAGTIGPLEHVGIDVEIDGRIRFVGVGFTSGHACDDGQGGLPVVVRSASTFF